jgi:hypothetical protein
MTQVSIILIKYLYIYINMYFTTVLRGKIRKEKKVEERWGRRPKVVGAAAIPKLNPMDQRWRPPLLASTARRGRPLARLPEQTSGVGKCSGRASCPGRPGSQKSSRPTMIVARPRRRACHRSYPHVRGPCPASPIGPTYRGDDGHALAPPPVLPPAPPGLSHVGREESNVPPAPNQGW